MLPGDGGFAGRTFMFVGRNKELAELRKGVVSHPHYRVLNVYGPAGIGKTHLLYRFADELRAQGACVIWLNALEIEPSIGSFTEALCHSLEKVAFASCAIDYQASLSSTSQSTFDSIAYSETDSPEAAVCERALGGPSDPRLRRPLGAGSAAIESAVSLLRSVADTMQTAIVIDDYEAAPMFDDVFRRTVLPALDRRTLVVVASWHPLTRLWESDPASLSETRCMALPYLTPQEAEEVLRRRGITEQGTLDRIILFAGGLPLALVLAADAELGAESTEESNVEKRRQATYRGVAHEVFRRVAREIEDGDTLSLLEAACVVRRCNEELLSHLAGRHVTALDINKLTGLSFVHPTEEGLAVDDEIRNVILEDMRWRAPNRLAALRRLATDWMGKDRRVLGTDDILEYVFLAPDPLLRRYFFTEWGDVTLSCDGAPPKLSEIADVYRTWMREYLGQEEDRLGEVDQIASLFELYKDRFTAVREPDGRLAGFTCLIPVEERSLPILRMSEVTRLCVDNLPGPRSASHVLLFPFIMSSTHAYQVRAALVKAVFEWQTKRDVHAVFTTWVHDEMAASRAEQLLFTQVRDPVCMAYGPGMPITYYYLDLTKKSARAWMNEVLGRQEGPQRETLSQQELLQEVVLCLRHFWNDRKLEHSRMAHLGVVARRLARPGESGKADGESTDSIPASLPAAIRSVLKGALDILAQGTGRFAFRFGAEEAKLVRMAYIDRVGSHECVMERLGLPRTTYYRRLRQALRNLATILASLEEERGSV
ncbi:MAG: DUF1492 domain-containing protein [Firmicutes bacterium]|nr:DUF1492 domain-containing protein [Bacillota bacterium]MDH7495346.1 DUF1492 domain-containing protein [Bacillota bacterium]